MFIDLARNLAVSSYGEWLAVCLTTENGRSLPGRRHEEVLSKLWSANESVSAVTNCSPISSIGRRQSTFRVSICLQPLSNLVQAHSVVGPPVAPSKSAQVAGEAMLRITIVDISGRTTSRALR